MRLRHEIWLLNENNVLNLKKTWEEWRDPSQPPTSAILPLMSLKSISSSKPQQKNVTSVSTWYLWSKNGFERANSLELLSCEYSLWPPIDACHTLLPAIAPLEAKSPEATSILFGCLPWTQNDPLALKRRGNMGPKCPLAASSPLLLMARPGRTKLPTSLQFYFYQPIICLIYLKSLNIAKWSPVPSSGHHTADSRIFAANHSYLSDDLPIRTNHSEY